uniref:Putative secreted peptide n=1 Tax=Anopheles braziliensis TaxID=58242 RepID=A0A2M3ZP08_9DIPT
MSSSWKASFCSLSFESSVAGSSAPSVVGGFVVIALDCGAGCPERLSDEGCTCSPPSGSGRWYDGVVVPTASRIELDRITVLPTSSPPPIVVIVPTPSVLGAMLGLLPLLTTVLL